MSYKVLQKSQIGSWIRGVALIRRAPRSTRAVVHLFIGRACLGLRIPRRLLRGMIMIYLTLRKFDTARGPITAEPLV